MVFSQCIYCTNGMKMPIDFRFYKESEDMNLKYIIEVSEETIRNLENEISFFIEDESDLE